MIQGEASPASAETCLEVEVVCRGLYICLIQQSDPHIILWQILLAEPQWEALPAIKIHTTTTTTITRWTVCATECNNVCSAHQPEASGDMGLRHGLDEAGVVGAELLLQRVGRVDGVLPGLVGRVHPVDQILPRAGSPLPPARKEPRK